MYDPLIILLFEVGLSLLIKFVSSVQMARQAVLIVPESGMSSTSKNSVKCPSVMALSTDDRDDGLDRNVLRLNNKLPDPNKGCILVMWQLMSYTIILI